MTIIALAAFAAITLSTQRMTIYFIDFRAETYFPKTRKSILENKGTIDRPTWSMVQSALRKAVSEHHSKNAKLNEWKIRLMLIDKFGHKWFVDQSGTVLSTLGSSGTISKKGVVRLNQVLDKAFMDPKNDLPYKDLDEPVHW